MISQQRLIVEEREKRKATITIINNKALSGCHSHVVLLIYYPVVGMEGKALPGPDILRQESFHCLVCLYSAIKEEEPVLHAEGFNDKDSRLYVSPLITTFHCWNLITGPSPSHREAMKCN